jgi:hypothetical protein
MKNTLRKLLLLAVLLNFVGPASNATAQGSPDTPAAIPNDYEPGPAYPFGRLNPDAPPETAQFAFLLGAFDCKERMFNQQDGTWKEATKIWNGRAFLNGYAIRDDTWRSDGVYTSNIRKYDADAGHWIVTYLSSNNATPSVWEGGKEGDTMVVRRDGEGPQGPYTARLMFHDVSADGFEWKMDILAGGQVLPWWTSSCKRRR